MPLGYVAVEALADTHTNTHHTHFAEDVVLRQQETTSKRFFLALFWFGGGIPLVAS